jgi:hypothetical protein
MPTLLKDRKSTALTPTNAYGLQRKIIHTENNGQPYIQVVSGFMIQEHSSEGTTAVRANPTLHTSIEPNRI